MGFKIGIIGLGLMGASLARALKGFRGAEIAGADTDAAVLEKARADGTVSRICGSAAEAVRGADLVILCVYAHHIPVIMRACADDFSPGAVISDICGVKGKLYRELAPLIPERADYVGIHPMAGKERDGFDNAAPDLYRGSGMIICPLPRTRPESVALMRELAEHIGSARIELSPLDKHDEIIAYTSDMMHISAAALCMDFHPDMTLAFTAGAFRDCTRVADINAPAWTELLMSNADNTIPVLDRYIRRLIELRDALSCGDDAALRGLLDLGGGNKRGMMKS